MAGTKRVKTVEEVSRQSNELLERASIFRALSSYLRTRYLPRDERPASQAIMCRNTPVSEAVIDEVSRELDDNALEMERAAVELLKSEVS